MRWNKLSVVSTTLVLFIFGLMLFQSAHRMLEHHEGAHHSEECSVCHWQFAPLEAGEIVTVEFHEVCIPAAPRTLYQESSVNWKNDTTGGRGPPFLS
jgi:hypothetical protein